ncbi:hypothetical protein [Haliangium sp.]|uniref:hypothetical protein n=1 Tax=Haliangium sp. TaxID=2663208 RepID=UPI003D125009
MDLSSLPRGRHPGGVRVRPAIDASKVPRCLALRGVTVLVSPWPGPDAPELRPPARSGPTTAVGNRRAGRARVTAEAVTLVRAAQGLRGPLKDPHEMRNRD